MAHYVNNKDFLAAIVEMKEKSNTIIQQQMIQHLNDLNGVNQQIQKIVGEHAQLIQILMKDNVEMKKRICVLEEILKKSV